MMKKYIKRSLIVLGALIAVVLVLALGFYLYLRAQIHKMVPLETGNITGSVHTIKDSYANMYLVHCDGGYIAIDAGNDPENVRLGLEELGIAPDAVQAIFLTHSDADHIGALELFENATIYLSKEEEKIIRGETSRFWFFKSKTDINNHIAIDDNQDIHLNGCTVTGLLTPGHTMGSMSYLVNSRYLFTGDNLSIKEGRIFPFMKFINDDTELQRSSIKKLSRLQDIDYIFTAHYGMSDDFEFAFRKWKEQDY
jgi:glyoxylase-like metal-dependent hydrolase (beta-lactamase superfamily II)